MKNVDLSVFRFDYDLTMMVFLMSGDGQIYCRYGGRDATNADRRQSLAGLRYAMTAAVAMHKERADTKSPHIDRPQYVRDLVGGRRLGGCVHCHQVKETIHRGLRSQGDWSREHIWRYPPPDNLGFVLENDRGDVVKRVEPDSPASRAGLRAGDVIETIGGQSIHSFGDAQFALDRAPKTGTLKFSLQRGRRTIDGRLALPQGWRKTDITWRRSMQWVVPAARVYGRDLTPDEKKSRGLLAKRLAFWQRYPVSSAAKAVGVREDDVILGFDGKQLEMKAHEFQKFVRRSYLDGDQVTIDVLRGDSRLKLPMTLRASD